MNLAIPSFFFETANSYLTVSAVGFYGTFFDDDEKVFRVCTYTGDDLLIEKLFLIFNLDNFGVISII